MYSGVTPKFIIGLVQFSREAVEAKQEEFKLPPQTFPRDLTTDTGIPSFVTLPASTPVPPFSHYPENIVDHIVIESVYL